MRPSSSCQEKRGDLGLQTSRLACDSHARLGFNKRNGEEGLIELCYSFRRRHDGLFERRSSTETVPSCHGREDRNIALSNLASACLNHGGESVASLFSWQQVWQLPWLRRRVIGVMNSAIRRQPARSIRSQPTKRSYLIALIVSTPEFLAAMVRQAQRQQQRNRPQPTTAPINTITNLNPSLRPPHHNPKWVANFKSARRAPRAPK